MKKTMVLVAIMGLLMVGCGKQLTPKQLNSYDQSKDIIPSKDGKRHGVMKQYTRGGDILHTTTYVNGIKEGKEVVYSKGRLGMGTYYKNGKKHGLETTYFYTPVRVKSTTPYVNGKIEGIKKRWHSNGKMLWYRPFKNGLANGIAYLWDENGEELGRMNYINGVSQHKIDIRNSRKRRARSYCQDLSESLFTTEDKGRFIRNCHGTKSYQRIYGK